MEFHPLESIKSFPVQQKVWDVLRETFKDDDGLVYFKFPLYVNLGRQSKEPDFVMLHRRYGLWVFSIEGCTVRNISRIDDYLWSMDDWSSESIEPVWQAEEYLATLKEKFRRYRKLKISQNFRVMLPEAQLEEWKSRGFDQYELAGRNVWVGEDLTTSRLRERFEEASGDRNRINDEEWEQIKKILWGEPGVVKEPREIPSGAPVQDPRRVIHAIESQIKGLDETQLQIAYYIPEGPQRLRGLAGTGKTVLLAKRAAIAHARHPEWKIAFVFYTKSIRDQVRNLIEAFYRDLTRGNRPDWEKLKVFPSWGGNTEPGFYFDLATASGMLPESYKAGKEFAQVCEALERAKIPEIYDAILIDEGQDLPPSFYRIAYRALKAPKRLYWGYDEAQGTGSLLIPDVKTLFGSNSDIDLAGNFEGGVHKSYRMNKVYRTPQLLLMAAHAINMGLFRKDRILQGVSTQRDWDMLGYKIIDGDFSPASVAVAKKVTITRQAETSVHPINRKDFEYQESDVNVLSVKRFASANEEVAWIVSSIAQDLKNGFKPTDIVIITIRSYRQQEFLKAIQTALTEADIQPYIAGETPVNGRKRPDIYQIDGCITISGTHRAKGNEAWKVYACGFHNILQNGTGDKAEELKKRNEAMVALTRAKIWCVVTGCEPSPIFSELDQVLAQYPNFSFPAFNKASLSRNIGDD